jgi:hypothetical protein
MPTSVAFHRGLLYVLNAGMPNNIASPPPKELHARSAHNVFLPRRFRPARAMRLDRGDGFVRGVSELSERAAEDGPRSAGPAEAVNDDAFSSPHGVRYQPAGEHDTILLERRIARLANDVQVLEDDLVRDKRARIIGAGMQANDAAKAKAMEV